MVDALAEEYADDPVLFIEYDVDNPPVNRYDRWWTANGNSTVYLPLVMVDSGYRFSSGPEDFDSKYRTMVNGSLDREPRARLVVSRERVGDSFEFEVQLTNLTEMTLQPSNVATIHAIVYEEAKVADTGRYVRAAVAEQISSLAPAQTKTYSIVVPVTGANWSRLHSVVIVDYRPAGDYGSFDTLQAAHQY